MLWSKSSLRDLFTTCASLQHCDTHFQSPKQNKKTAPLSICYSSSYPSIWTLTFLRACYWVLPRRTRIVTLPVTDTACAFSSFLHAWPNFHSMRSWIIRIPHHSWLSRESAICQLHSTYYCIVQLKIEHINMKI